jgi:hypothetical protein
VTCACAMARVCGDKLGVGVVRAAFVRGWVYTQQRRDRQRGSRRRSHERGGAEERASMLVCSAQLHLYTWPARVAYSLRPFLPWLPLHVPPVQSIFDLLL